MITKALNMPEVGKHIETLLFIGIGLYLIVYGARSKILINESEVVATEEEKRNAIATPARRLVMVAAGLGGVVYGIVRLLR
jgi:hypothetical protein